MARDVLWVFARTCAAEEPQGGRGGCDRGSFVMCGPRARLDRTAFGQPRCFSWWCAEAQGA
eukprot:scaffold122631_cov69-Phaeocystis_antarctica.AAC.2